MCADNGIGYYDAKGELINIDTGDFNSSIDHMTADYQGNLWFTSSRLGLLRLSRSSFTQLKYVQNTESSVVNSVCKMEWKILYRYRQWTCSHAGRRQ